MLLVLFQLFRGSFAYSIQMPRLPFSKFSMMEVLGEMFIGEGHLTVKVKPLGSHGRSPWFN